MKNSGTARYYDFSLASCIFLAIFHKFGNWDELQFFLCQLSVPSFFSHLHDFS